MAISRWCAAPEPEIWQWHNEETDQWENSPVDQHDRCKFEWRKGHCEFDDYCWSDDEREARLCTCKCHSPLV